MNNIIVYTKANCHYCVSAKNLLRSKGYDFTEMVIETDISRSDFINLFPAVKSAPLILVNGDAIGGYNELTEWIQHDNRSFLAE